MGPRKAARRAEPSREFLTQDLRPVVAGVYFLFLSRQLTYIGRSKDCYGRIEAHRRNGRRFDYASVMPTNPIDVGWIEVEPPKAFGPNGHREPSEPAAVSPSRAPPIEARESAPALPRASAASATLLRFADLKDMGIVRNWPQLHRMVEQLAFPRGFYLTSHARVWDRADIEAWLQERRQGRRTYVATVSAASAAQGRA